MSRKTKIWLITAACLVLLGGMLFGGALMMANWDLTKLETTKHETNHYSITEAFEKIAITTDTADVIFLPSEEGKISVECYEQTRAKHRVTVKDGVLEIRLVDERKWYDHIGINFKSPRITVSLPAGQYGALTVQASTGKVNIPEDFAFEAMDITLSTGDVTCAASASGEMKIKTSTGDISLHNSSAGTLALSATTGEITARGIACTDGVKLNIHTGDIRLTDVKCKTLAAESSTGDLLLKNVIVEEAMSVETSTGEVSFDRCDAGEMTVKTSTGSVTGSLLTPKIFFAETDTGKVDVPKTTTGGKCEITTDTGSIRITITE